MKYRINGKVVELDAELVQSVQSIFAEPMLQMVVMLGDLEDTRAGKLRKRARNLESTLIRRDRTIARLEEILVAELRKAHADQVEEDEAQEALRVAQARIDELERNLLDLERASQTRD